MLLGEVTKLETSFESLMNPELLNLIKQYFLASSEEGCIIVMKFDEASTSDKMTGSLMMANMLNPEIYSSEELLDRWGKGYRVHSFTLNSHMTAEAGLFFHMKMVETPVVNHAFTGVGHSFDKLQLFFILTGSKDLLPFYLVEDRKQGDKVHLVRLAGNYQEFSIKYNLSKVANDKNVVFTVKRKSYECMVFLSHPATTTATTTTTTTTAVELATVNQFIKVGDNIEGRSSTAQPNSSLFTTIKIADFLEMERKLYRWSEPILNKLADLAYWCEFISKSVLGIE